MAGNLFTAGGLLRRTEVTATLADGTHKATWSGVPLLQRGGRRVMGARWRLGPRQVGPVRFAPGDLCLELFDTELDFNIFEILRPVNNAPGRSPREQRPPRYQLQGWYVNLAAAATLERQGPVEKLQYTDWELDYIVQPDGRVTILDADAYAKLPAFLPEDEYRRIEKARQQLEARLQADGPNFIRSLYREAARGPGDAFLLRMVRRYGLPVAAHGQEAHAIGFSGYWAEAIRAGSRVGEALFALDEGRGETLLHGKAFYPNGLVRLPGGGIAAEEKPDVAAVREAKEETGLQADAARFAAYLTVPLKLEQELYFMPTYVFQLQRRRPGALPPPHPQEDIDRWQRLPFHQLSTLAWRLARLPEDWRGWGRYRALQHWVAYQGLVGLSRRDAPGKLQS